MSYKFSSRSLKNLSECDERLQKLFGEVIKHIDCVIIEGHRSQVAQDKAYNAGRSMVKFPNSKHNKVPSKAVDAMPWPVDWGDIEGQCYFAGLVLGIASQMGIRIRWGGDFNMNNDLRDQTFFDSVHFELY